MVLTLTDEGYAAVQQLARVHVDSVRRAFVDHLDRDHLPLRRDPHDRQPGGIGLNLVHGLSRGWGVEVSPDGKVVWCELGADPAG